MNENEMKRNGQDLSELELLRNKIQTAKNEIGKEMIGQKDLIQNVLLGILCGGNLLLEGMPGLGKTRLVSTISRVVGLSFKRIQFTPDLMPSDITGTNMIEQKDGTMSFRFEEGPIFAGLILADEINRATPKTQAALLEAMQEHTVTIGKVSHKLPEPFFVLATENPIETEGTFPLPEAQLDRFFMKLIAERPSKQELKEILLLNEKEKEEKASSALTGEDLLKAREWIKKMPVSEAVMDFLLNVIEETGKNTNLLYGAGPRGAESLLRSAKALAFLEGRYNVSFDDVERMTLPVLRHRIGLNYDAISEGKTEDLILLDILRKLRQSGN